MDCHLSAADLAEISQLTLMKGVDVESLSPLLTRCRVCTFTGEELVLSPRSARDGVYLVLAGRLRIHLQTPDDEPVSLIEKGEGVGELSLLMGAPRSAFVIADEASRLLQIPTGVFWELLEASHELTLNYLRMLSSRLRQNNDVVVENRALQQLYKRHAMTDGLTGLHNRRWFDMIYPRLFSRSAKQDIPLSVIMLDIDHFKRFNDTHGHQAGDFALFIIAQILKSCFRPTDLIARYGGEEFVVMMPYTTIEEAQNAAERVRKAVEDTHLEMPDGLILTSVTISLGAASFQASEGVLLEEGVLVQESQALVKRADEALYRAKDNGRNRVEA